MQKPLSPQLYAVATSQMTLHVIEWSGGQSHLISGSLDDLTRATATDIAWCANVDRARRASWSRTGDLKGRPPFTEHDALETALAFSLNRGRVSQKIARSAWRLIRHEVKRLLIAGERDIWIVVGPGGHRAWALASAEDAAHRANGEGSCWIIAAKDALQEASVRYGQLDSRLAAPRGQVAQLPQSRNVRPAE